MTIAEILREADARNFIRKEDMKKEAQFTYIEAQLIGCSVGRLFDKNGKYPKLYEVFPELFSSEMEEEHKMELSTARFLAFANQHNKQFNEVK